MSWDDEVDDWVWLFVPQEDIDDMLTKDEIHNRYHYHAPTPAARVLHDMFNGALEHIATEIEAKIPEGRAKALAHTKLEECKMWVNAAIAQNHDKL